MDKKIPWEIYRECTLIAKSYYDLLEQRRDIEKEILLGSNAPADGMPRSPGVGDPTEQKAEALIQRKAEVEKKIHALQTAFEHLEEEWERKLIRLNLFREQRIPMECLTAHGVNVCVRTMKQKRREFILDVAQLLGMIE